MHCDNLTFCWLLKRIKDMGCLGRWILWLAPFTFRVTHTHGVDNGVADAVSDFWGRVSRGGIIAIFDPSLLFARGAPEEGSLVCGSLR
jgi:hypothetical protein